MSPSSKTTISSGPQPFGLRDRLPYDAAYPSHQLACAAACFRRLAGLQIGKAQAVGACARLYADGWFESGNGGDEQFGDCARIDIGLVRDQRDALTMSVGHGHISRLPAGQRPSVGIPSGGVDQIGVGLKCRFRFLAVRVSVGILHDAVAGTYSETAHARGEIACARSADRNAGIV